MTMPCRGDHPSDKVRKTAERSGVARDGTPWKEIDYVCDACHHAWTEYSEK